METATRRLSSRTEACLNNKIKYIKKFIKTFLVLLFNFFLFFYHFLSFHLTQPVVLSELDVKTKIIERKKKTSVVIGSSSCEVEKQCATRKKIDEIRWAGWWQFPLYLSSRRGRVNWRLLTDATVPFRGWPRGRSDQVKATQDAGGAFGVKVSVVEADWTLLASCLVLQILLTSGTVHWNRNTWPRHPGLQTDETRQDIMFADINGWRGWPTLTDARAVAGGAADQGGEFIIERRIFKGI